MKPRNKNAMSIADLRDLIERQYHLMTPATIAALAGRSVGYVTCVASAMGCKCVGRGKNHDPYWTLQEKRIVREQYGRVPVVHLAKELRRTPATIQTMAHRLGLGRRRSKAWDTEQDQLIRDHYPLRGAAWCGLQLGRSVDAIKHRARHLGVRRDMQQYRIDHPWTKEIAADVAQLREKIKRKKSA